MDCELRMGAGWMGYMGIEYVSRWSLDVQKMALFRFSLLTIEKIHARSMIWPLFLSAQGRAKVSRWNSSLPPWVSRREPVPSSTAPTQTVPPSTSLGISKSLESILSSSLTSVQIWKENRPKDSPFYLIRKPNTFPCTSQPLSLETQPSTSARQVHTAPQAPAACLQTCLLGWSGALLCIILHEYLSHCLWMEKKQKDIKVYKTQDDSGSLEHIVKCCLIST